MPEGLRIALALPLLMPKIPLTSLAVIAAIAVLVYEVRSFFGRSAPGTPLSPATGGPPTLPVPKERPRARASEPTADRVVVLRAEPISLSEPEAPPLAATGTPPYAALPPSRSDVITAAALPKPVRAPIMTPRESLRMPTTAAWTAGWRWRARPSSARRCCGWWRVPPAGAEASDRAAYRVTRAAHVVVVHGDGQRVPHKAVHRKSAVAAARLGVQAEDGEAFG
ncbi:MAG: hypothetical protein M3P30_08275 [Chloroflexota bacterium]|nr:hypothetical protein [Chloroflexota bacterium]